MKNKPFLYLHQYIYIISKEILEQKKLLLQCWLRGAGNLIILIYKNPKIGFMVLRSSYSPVTYMTDYSIFYAFWHVCAHYFCPRQCQWTL